MVVYNRDFTSPNPFDLDRDLSHFVLCFSRKFDLAANTLT